jgi:hypothetical protein
MGLYLRQRRINKTLYAFDSFEGFDPHSVLEDLKLGGTDEDDRQESGFSNTSFELVSRKVDSMKLQNVRLVKGYFTDTLSAFAHSCFAFVHLDVDLYDSYRDCLRFFYPRVVTGGVILFDEYNDPPWPGCNKAVDEFMMGKPESLQLIQMDNYQKWYLVKEG